MSDFWYTIFVLAIGFATGFGVAAYMLDKAEVVLHDIAEDDIHVHHTDHLRSK